MSEQPSDQQQRPRRQGDRNRSRGNYNNNRRQGPDPDRKHETYRRNEEPSEYTPPRDLPDRGDRRPKTFGGGEYERVYRDKPEPKKPGTLGKTLLRFFSFGLLGRDKKPSTPKPGARPVSKDRNDRDRNRSGKPQDRDRRGPRNDRPNRGERPERPEKDRSKPQAERREREPQPKRENNGPRQPRPANTNASSSGDSQQRPPAPLDLDAITSERLHVGNLSYDTVESDLFEVFNGFGKVMNAEIVTHSRTQRSKGFGFIQMANVDDARRAATELHGKPFMGRVLIIGPAKGAKPERSADRTRELTPEEVASSDAPASDQPSA